MQTSEALARSTRRVVDNAELGAWARQLSATALGSEHLARGPAAMTASELIDRAQLLEHLSSAIAAEHARTAAAFSDVCSGRVDSLAPADGASSEFDAPEPDGGVPRPDAEAPGSVDLGEDVQGAVVRAEAQELRNQDLRARAAGWVTADARERRARVRSTAAQIALARKVAPSRGARIVELSTILVHDMPDTLERLAEGTLTEVRAFSIAASARGLSSEDRAEVDRRLCSDRGRIAHLGDRGIEDAARRLVEEVDRGAAAERIRRAEADRHVSVRRLPDAMAKVTAILPVAGAMAMRESLAAAAEAAKAAGDARCLGQIAADTLIERTTGLADAGRVPLRIGLVMTDRTLLAGGAEPAVLPGYGTVPADWARELVARALGNSGTIAGEPLKDRERVWLERLFTAPETGQLVALDSKARLFPASMGRFLRTRDQTCRTSYCDAPTRHFDHVVPAAAGGPTTADNGQCLCAFCNLTKESPGWRQEVVAAEGGTLPRPAPRAKPPSTGPESTPVAGIRFHVPGDRDRVVLIDASRHRAATSASGTRLANEHSWLSGCPSARLRARAGRSLRPSPASHTVETRTPTGHLYRSLAPGLPGSPGP